jgi:glycine oxidase
VAVVGGGVIGLACGWRAAQRGLRVCVLERSRPGGGSTHAAAGLLTPVTDAEFGEEALVRLSLASAQSYPAFAAELERVTGRDVGYRRTGTLYAALDRDEVEELRRLHALHERLGLEAQWLSGRECRRLEPGLTTACVGGVRAATEAQVDPRRLATALGEALVAAGGELRTQAEVVEALREGGRVTGVVTADGSQVAATRIVVAAGCWSGRLDWLPEVAVPVRPVKGQIVRLRAPVGALPAGAVVRTRWVYVVPREDGEVVVGATVEERGFDETVTAGGVHELLREAYRVLPEIAELELVEACARLRPGSPDNAPLVGASSASGVLLATGHFRNGILLAPITADAIAVELAGEEPVEGLERFSPARFETVPA